MAWDLAFTTWVDDPGSPSTPGASDINRLQNDFVWLNSPPRFCIVPANNTVSIPDSADTPITWTNDATAGRYNYSGSSTLANMFTATDLTSATVVLAGTYDVGIRARWQGNAAGWRIINLVLNGTQIATNGGPCASSAHTYNHGLVVQGLNLAAGDVVQPTFFQDSGAALNLNKGTNQLFTAWTMRWVCGPS